MHLQSKVSFIQPSWEVFPALANGYWNKFVHHIALLMEDSQKFLPFGEHQENLYVTSELADTISSTDHHTIEIFECPLKLFKNVET